MPGIFGLIDKAGTAGMTGKMNPAEALNVMTEVMHYEPFYESRQDVYEGMGLYVGWVGHSHANTLRPVIDPNAGLSLYLAGAPHCNSIGIGRERQALSGAHEQGTAIVGYYEKLGESFPEKIDGLVSGLLVDVKRGQCLLFTDRLGAERIFFYEDSEKIAFSSEAKAILAITPDTRGFDPEGLGQFMTWGCMLGDKSLYRGIRTLPGGSAIRFAGRAVKKQWQYFDRSTWEELEPLQDKAYLERFTSELHRVVNQSARPGCEAAISLTGGLDCRMIMAGLRAPAETIPCYTFGSMYRETYDVQIAGRVAKECHQRHEVLELGPDFLNNFRHYARRAVYISDGYLGFSGAAELYLNGLARTIAPSRITGNYGGELLRGVRAFGPSMPKGGFLKPDLQTIAEASMRACSNMDEMRPASFTLFIQVPANYGRSTIERSQVAVRSPFLDKALVELIYQMPAKLKDSVELSRSVVERLAPELLAIPTDRGLLGSENRSIKAARRLYNEALFKLEYWTGNGLPNRFAWLSHFGLDTAYEHIFRGHHKFQHFRLWLRSELAFCIKSILSEYPASLNDYFDHANVQKILNDHLAGQANYTEELDKIVTIILAERVLINAGREPKETRH